MPSFCVVANCEHKYAKPASVSFHKFPFHTSSLLNQWIAFAERDPSWKPTRWSAICSRHFRTSDYRDHTFRKCLKRTATPSVNVRSTLFEFVDTPMQFEAANQHPDMIGDTITALPFTKESTTTIQQDVITQPSKPVATLTSFAEAVLPTLPPPESSQLLQSKLTESVAIFLHYCRLCGRSVPNAHHLDESAIATVFQKCCPTIQLDSDVRLSRQACSECTLALNGFMRFLDRIISTQAELQRRLCVIGSVSNTTATAVTPSETLTASSEAAPFIVPVKPTNTSMIVVSNRPHQTTQTAKLVHIKQEPSLCLANVKQEFVESSRTAAGAVAASISSIATTSTSTSSTNIPMIPAIFPSTECCAIPVPNPMQPIKYAPCLEIQPDNDAFCEFCDVYFINNLELKTHIVNYHNSTATGEITTNHCNPNERATTTASYQNNNCEIMEIITLENAFINLAEDAEQTEAAVNNVNLHSHQHHNNSEDMIPLERVLKVEHFNDYEQREQHSFVIRREHSYCRRSDIRLAAIAVRDSGDLKQEIKTSELIPITTTEMPVNPLSHQIVEMCLESLRHKCVHCTETFETARQKYVHHYRVHRTTTAMSSIASLRLKNSYRVPMVLHCTNCSQRFSTRVAFRNHRAVCERWHRMLTGFLRARGSYRTRALGRIRSAISSQVLKGRRQQQNHSTNDSATTAIVDDRYECLSCGRFYAQYDIYQRHLELHQPMMVLDANNYNAPASIEENTAPSAPTIPNASMELDNGIVSQLEAEALEPTPNAMPPQPQCQTTQTQTACVKCVIRVHCTESHEAGYRKECDVIDKAPIMVKPYACAKCDKRFRCPENLRQHTVTHTTDRKYACELCDKTFKRPAGLKQHVQGFHYKIRPHVCTVCRYAYALKADMKRCRHSTMKTNM